MIADKAYPPASASEFEKYTFHRRKMRNILLAFRITRSGTPAYEAYTFHEMQAALHNLPGFYDECTKRFILEAQSAEAKT